ncbi:hypothetical protein [Flaviaesturariibacter amylovorans]|uniref:Fibronectin type-III domain-containing protein n=1 Tax=Flaviaesturariibacter amylovorans TaxID=1084520 RepID=A0ABP8GG64_9BACT
MNCIARTLVLYFCCLLSLGAAAQPRQVSAGEAAVIRVIARAYEDSVVLRWAPSTAAAWDYLNKTGYRLVRVEVTDDKQLREQLLTTEPLKPFPLEQMKAKLGPENRMAAVAAQALYGKTFQASGRTGFAGQIADQGDMFRNRYAYALLAADYDAPTAQAIGLRFVDRNVRKGSAYVYKVLPAQRTSGEPIDSAVVAVSNNASGPLSAPGEFVAIGGDHRAELQWSRYQDDHYTGYFIEKSTDGKTFRPLNSVPFYSSVPDTVKTVDSIAGRIRERMQQVHVFLDSLDGNYREYYYRIRGINAFGERGPFSKVVTVSGRDQRAPLPPSPLPVELLGGRSIRLRWHKTDVEPDLAGYYINRARSVNGPFELVSAARLPRDATSFVDTAAYLHGATFYTVVAIDTAFNYAPSLPVMAVLPDSIAPAAPAGLEGRVTREGIVQLSWKPNSEEDLRTYKVYVSNNPAHHFSQITVEDLADPAFVDSITLETLSKDIYYRVVAVDYNNNHSPYSEILKLRKPDIVPPVKPVLRGWKVDGGKAVLDIVQSSSDDVTGYVLWRREDKGEWMPVAAMAHDSTRTAFTYTDSTLRPKVRYEYAAEAVDEDSLRSGRSVAIPVHVFSAPARVAVEKLEAAYDAKSGQVALAWKHNEAGDYFYVLYRDGGNGALERLRSLDKEVQSFSDGSLPSRASSCRYALQVVYRDDRGESLLSPPVTVSIRQ